MGLLWQADGQVVELLTKVKNLHHLPRLQQATISVCFDESKPFRKNVFNWGKVVKFSPITKLHQNSKVDFCICISSEVWQSLNLQQREALLDLHLSCCSAEYVPQVNIVNGKKVVVKDEVGRTQYTDEFKEDVDGNIIWRKLPLTIEVMQDNIMRYGCWISEFYELKVTMSNV